MLDFVQGFYCWGYGQYVVCTAPIFCCQDCQKYRAKIITGVKERDGKLTGYVNGMYLVTVDKK